MEDLEIAVRRKSKMSLLAFENKIDRDPPYIYAHQQSDPH